MNYFLYGTAGALPEIPQFSKAPYCLLISPTMVVYSSVPIVVYLDDKEAACGGAYEYYGLQALQNGEWQGSEPSINSVGKIMYKYIDLYWANHDIKDENGTLYLAASDPVPVGSVTARNPAAMLMGFQLGTAIRRMRGK